MPAGALTDPAWAFPRTMSAVTGDDAPRAPRPSVAAPRATMVVADAVPGPGTRESLPDAALVARVIRNDDRHAFAELVRRHQSSVRTLLRRLTRGNHALADDLAQD